MSTTNYPSATPKQDPPKRDSKNIIIAILSVGILGTWAYFLIDKNRTEKDIALLQGQYSSADSAKNALEITGDVVLENSLNLITRGVTPTPSK